MPAGHGLSGRHEPPHVDRDRLRQLRRAAGRPFCQACGQKAAGLDVSLHDFLHEAFHEFAHLDGKIARTLKVLVTKRGVLTTELRGSFLGTTVKGGLIAFACVIVIAAAILVVGVANLSGQA